MDSLLVLLQCCSGAMIAGHAGGHHDLIALMLQGLHWTGVLLCPCPTVSLNMSPFYKPQQLRFSTYYSRLQQY